jgi:hypothetical protein
MCGEIELPKIDTTTDEYSNEDSSDPSEDSSSEEVKERSKEFIEMAQGKAAATEAKIQGERVDKAMGELDHQQAVAEGLREARKAETKSNSTIEVKARSSPTAEEKAHQEKAEKTLKESKDLHDTLPERIGKPVIFLRFKFWSVVLGITATMIAGVLGYVLSQPSNPDAIPKDVRDLLDKKITEWRSEMTLDEFLDKVSNFIFAWHLSTLKQSYIVSQLMTFIKQPDGVAAFDAQELNGFVDDMLKKYHAATAPKSMSLYSTVKTFTRKDESSPGALRPLTKHEALSLIDLVLAKINTLDPEEG